MKPLSLHAILGETRRAVFGGVVLAASWLTAGLLGTGCGLPLSEKLDATANVCTASSECGAGAQCNVDGQCVATTANLGRVLIEFQTPTLTYLDTSWEGINGAVPGSVNFSVPPLKRFTGSLRVADDTTGCAAEDESIPAKAELRSVLPYPTLGATYTTTLQQRDGLYRFVADVPPGNYDVHVKPDTSFPGCDKVNASPRFFGNVDVGNDTAFTVPYTEEVLTGQATIATGGSGAPIGWMIELVEPKYGLVVSNTVTLAAQDGVAPFSLRYSYNDNMVLRLRRPDGNFTLHWLAEGLGALDDVRLNLEELGTSPVNQIAYVVYDGTTPIRATVTIQSQHLAGTLGQGASFRVVTEADEQGKINVDLIPGTYQVSLAPLGNEAASTHIEEWKVPVGAGCCGKTFVLPAQPQIIGQVVRPDGSPFSSAPIVVTPSLSALSQQDYFDKVRAAQTLLPRQASANAGLDGMFGVAVDEGSLDFAVRPDASSYFPWLIIPSLLVAPVRHADQPPQQVQVDLGEIPIRAPVVIDGKVAISGSSAGLSGARVRAYVPTSTDPAKPTSVVLIGEAVAGDDGTFTLLLPPELGTRPAE